VGRTAGAHRKYYYRRKEFGYWTPWEQIKLDIEDNPVIPVVWKNSEGNSRLLLFWLRILKKGPDAVDRPRSGKLVELDAQAMPADPQFAVQAVLCWSEYYNGKWQPTKTSDPDKPTAIGSYLPREFDRSDLHLGVMAEGDALRIYIQFAPPRSPLIYLNNWPGSFLFRNTHSLPVRGEDTVKPPPSNVSGRIPLTDNSHTGDFAFDYEDAAGTELQRSILRPTTQPPPFTAVWPRQDLDDPWNAPMFFADGRHVFLISTREQPVWVRNFGGYGTLGGTAGGSDAIQIAPLVIQPPPATRPMVSTDAFIKRGLTSNLPVRFGDHLIGHSVSLSNGRARL
jgi:Neuraminidase-like domain